MRNLIALCGNKVLHHFRERLEYLQLLMRLETTAEGWFRIELLRVFDGIREIAIEGTNKKAQGAGSRPDFMLKVRSRPLLVELKVLPTDRNYRYGWQRFVAGSNNKRDFERLGAADRDGVIYIYWPNFRDWKVCAANIEGKYAVECVRHDPIPCSSGHVVLSYWATRGDAEAKQR